MAIADHVLRKQHWVRGVARTKQIQQRLLALDLRGFAEGKFGLQPAPFGA
jgi:hypothetical protein